MFDKNVLKGMKLPELKEIAKKVGVEKLNLKKEELIDAVLVLQNEFQKNEPKAETPVKEEKLSEEVRLDITYLRFHLQVFQTY